MKKLGIIAVAAMLSIAPAFAQDAVDPNTQLSIAGTNSNFETFLGGFGNADFTASFDALDKATSVNIITVSSMANLDAEAAKGAFTGREADLDALRGRLQGNAVVGTALASAGISLDQVVAVSTTDDGSVTLFINDLS